MESYVEVSFLYNAFTLMLSFLMARYICIQPLSIQKIISYSLCISGVGCSLFMEGSLGCMVLLEGILFFLFFRQKIKTWWMAQVIRFLWYMSVFAIYQGSFHNFLWFPSIHTNLIWIGLLYVFLFCLLEIKWKDVFSKLQYCYYFNIKVEQHTLRVKGWLDSGNLLSYEGIPVLFILPRYEEYFKNQNIQLVVMNTMEDSSVISCYECEVALEGGKFHDVLICCKEMHLPLKCEALLNMNMMTLG